MSQPRAPVSPLGSGSLLDVPTAGGKGAALDRLISLGVRVPPGVVVTTAAFRDHLHGAGWRDELGALCDAVATDVAKVCSEAGEAVMEAPVAAPILEAIREAWEAWRATDGSVRLVVRSSATVEDGTAHSFAGVFESVAVADESELADAIRSVWASVFRPRAVSYCRDVGLPSLPEMAVVVQPMIEPDRSGVMFTRFGAPDGEPRVLIEHVAGHCDKLVTGEVDPDRLWAKRWSHSGPAVDGLSRAIVDELLATGRRLEEAFEAPLDIEWCVRGEDLHLVQARPITAVASAGADGDGVRGALLTGLGASRGQASGPVHLVHHIEDADALTDGAVLVTPMTNPDMVPAMRSSVGVVTDVGGMICHAAIVSRELGIPCVVGTGRASSALAAGSVVTVDGDRGAVFDGATAVPDRTVAEPLTWDDLWREWAQSGAEMPWVSTIVALENAADLPDSVGLDPWLDLTRDDRLWAVSLADSQGRWPEYLERVSKLVDSGVREVVLSTARLGEHGAAFAAAAGAVAGVRVTDAPAGAFLGSVLASGVVDGAQPAEDRGAVFGTPPAMRRAPMPPDERRAWTRRWIAPLGAAHEGFAREDGEFDWLDPRPEVVITPMLKSVVFAGMESIPHVMGFAGMSPMHVQWIRCRMHFRRDTFLPVVQRLMAATWDEGFLADMLARTRASYERFERAASAFPADAEAWRAASTDELRDVLHGWWEAFAEFFALSFFIQAQGDDAVAPRVASLVERAHRAAAERAAALERSLPAVAELTAPTRSVLTAQYMSDLLALKAALTDAGVDDVAAGVAAARGAGAVRPAVDRVLDRWGWMRERDPFFAPYDTESAVIEKALASAQRPPTDYQANVEQGWLALSVLCDLSGDEAPALAYGCGYQHHLAVERENHHLVWLRCSYRFRQFVCECARRLDGISEADVFFLELPELLDAMERAPAGLSDDLAERVRHRRAAYLRESRLGGPGSEQEPQPVGDYY